MMQWKHGISHMVVSQKRHQKRLSQRYQEETETGQPTLFVRYVRSGNKDQHCLNGYQSTMSVLQLSKFYICMSITRAGSVSEFLLVGWGLVFSLEHCSKAGKSVPTLLKRNTGRIEWDPSILIQEMFSREKTGADRKKRVDTYISSILGLSTH